MIHKDHPPLKHGRLYSSIRLIILLNKILRLMCNLKKMSNVNIIIHPPVM